MDDQIPALVADTVATEHVPSDRVDAETYDLTLAMRAIWAGSAANGLDVEELDRGARGCIRYSSNAGVALYAGDRCTVTHQFLRRMSFTFDGGGGQTIFGGRNGELHLQAKINATTLQIPNEASIRIWNPSPIFINQANEFSHLTIQASYDDGANGSMLVIYSGDVKQARYGKENPVDSYLDVFCSDAGNAYQQARVSKTLAAGYTPADVLKAAADAMAPFGVTMAP